MYTNFRIQNFRGFKDLELKDLARVNLISGKNNVGKTSLLEALFLYSGGYLPELAMRVQSFRDVPVESSYWDTLFNLSTNNGVIRLKGSFDGQDERSLELELLSEREQLRQVENLVQQTENGNDTTTASEQSKVLELRFIDPDGTFGKSQLVQTTHGIRAETPPSPAVRGAILLPNKRSLNEDAQMFGNLVKAKKEHLLVEAMQIIEPRLDGILSIPYGDGPNQILVDIGLPQRIPLTLLGHGAVRLFSMIVRILDEQTEVMLIDEIDNGIHYSALRDVWTAIDRLVKQYNVQVFATTHSMEMIRAAHQAFADTGEDDFRYYRLDRDLETGDPVAVKYTQKTMTAAMEMGYEVRG
jgi:hypothetical protein